MIINALNELELEINRPDPQRILIEKPEQNALVFNNLSIAKLSGEVLVSGINERIRQGEHLLIKGDTASGSKLFKAIAGLWPWGSGSIELPDGEPMFFMSPRPYLPDGTLRAAICYPCLPEGCSLASLDDLFNLAGVGDLLGQLEQVDAWDKVLTREQQQRLGLVRLLLYAPKWVLIEEAFDSLSPDGGESMLRLICQQLPDATLIIL